MFAKGPDAAMAAYSGPAKHDRRIAGRFRFRTAHREGTAEDEAQASSVGICGHHHAEHNHRVSLGGWAMVELVAVFRDEAGTDSISTHHLRGFADPALFFSRW